MTEINTENIELYTKIKEWRLEKAKLQSLPEYQVLHKATVEELSNKEPKTIEELYSIKGVGLHKLRYYGLEILKLCSPDTIIGKDDLLEFITTKTQKKTKKVKKVTKPTTILDMLVPSLSVSPIVPNKDSIVQKRKAIIHDDKKIIKENTNTFSSSQKKAFMCYKKGLNCFITGPAGCGKTFLLKQIVKDARENGKCVEICAMTGCASILLNCKAKTLHSWAGLGSIKTNTDEEVLFNYHCKSYLKRNWRNTSILVVDEVSMMSKRLFNLLDKIGRSILDFNKPFGGIQIILSGDFYQLPPIGDVGIPDSYKFCFESKKWKKYIQKTVLLSTIFRQKEKNFMKLLNQIRQGVLSKKRFKLIQKYIGREYDLPFGLIPPTLLPKKNSVRHINNRELNKIKSSLKSYPYLINTGKKLDNIKNLKDLSKRDKQLHNSLLNNVLFEQTLHLKIGAQVMCIVNLDLPNGICNGSTGIVKEFSNGFPVVHFNNGIIRTVNHHKWVHHKYPTFSLVQIPLILAWAVTIHKSQGATLDYVEIDIGSGIFEYGQTYVALSRVKSLDGLYIKSFDPCSIMANPKVKKYYGKFKKKI